MKLRASVLAAILIAAGCSGGPSAPAVPPDMLVISLDTLRADHVGAYGYPLDTTPAIDALAAEGVVFDRAYAQAASTAPSHTSIFTSLYPTVHGIRKHGLIPDPAIPTLPALLRDAGYATAGFTQLAGETYSRGFDVWERLRQNRSEEAVVRNVAAITDWIDGQRDAPYFLFVHFYDVHLPFTPRPEYRERFPPPSDGRFITEARQGDIAAANRGREPITDTEREQLFALYDAELAAIDELVGRIFEHLRQAGRLDQTAVVVLSDHGEEFGEHGWYGHAHAVHEELIRTPLIMRVPGWEPARVEQAVRNLDVAPTLLSFAGIEIPISFQGADLTETLDGDAPDRVVLAETNSERGFISEGWKYVRPRRRPERLFDLSVDPNERDNLAERAPEQLARMRALADAWEAELEASAARVTHSDEVVLTPEEERRLRALGYIQ